MFIILPKMIVTEFKKELNLAIKLFIFGILFGVLLGFVYLTPERLANFIEDIFSDITAQIISSNHSFGVTFLALLRRNLTASLMMILLGLIHRFLPLAIIFFNGGIIGIIIWAMLSFGNILNLVLLIPHGVFELPALFLAAAYGISLTTKSEKGIKARFETLIKQKRLLLYIIGLLIIAGLIESGAIVLFS